MLRISHPATLHTGLILHSGHMSKIGKDLLHFAPQVHTSLDPFDASARRAAIPPRAAALMMGAEATTTRHRSGNFVHQHPFRPGALECPESSPPFKTFTLQTWLELPVAQAYGPLIHFQNSAR